MTLRAGKYVLQQGAVSDTSTISVHAAERLFPNRAVVCRFFFEGADFGRERRVLDLVPDGQHTPGA